MAAVTPLLRGSSGVLLVGRALALLAVVVPVHGPCSAILRKRYGESILRAIRKQIPSSSVLLSFTNLAETVFNSFLDFQKPAARLSLSIRFRLCLNQNQRVVQSKTLRSMKTSE